MSNLFEMLLRGKLDTKDIEKTLKSLQSRSLKLNTSIDTKSFGNMQKQLQATLKTNIDKWNRSGLIDSNFKKNISELQTMLNSATNTSGLNNYRTNLKLVSEEFKRLNMASQSFNRSDAFNRMKSNSLNKIDTFLKQNTALTKESRDQFLNLRRAIETTGDARSLKNLNGELTNLQRTMVATGEAGRSLGDEMKNNFKKFATWVGASAIFFGVQRTIRGVINNVKELDTAMTSLYKVTNETDAKYNSFLQNAYKSSQKLGQSVTNIVEQTAQWAKLGYGVDDAAKLAEISSIYSNVGEVDNQTAVSDIVTAMKAYQISSDNAMSIIDAANELGNNYAVSSAGLGEGLKNAASALALGGANINKSLALLTGGGEITQNVGELGKYIAKVA